MGDKLIEIINNVEDIKSTVDGSIHTSLQDTTTNLINAKNDLADNLETKGITGLTGDETLTELVPEVLNIQSIEDYFNTTANTPASINGFLVSKLLKKCPDIYIGNNVSSLGGFFANWKYATAPKIFFGNNVTSIAGMVGTNTYDQYPDKLTTIDVSGFNVSNVTTMSQLFSHCTSLTNIIGMDQWNDTSKLQNMAEMFGNCSNLTSLDLSNFNTSNVTNMSFMFYYCSKLTNLTFGSNFNTNNVTNMAIMFSHCTSLQELDLSNFNTSNVTSMIGMFEYCTALTKLDIRNFDFSRVGSNWSNMFGSSASNGVPANCLIIVKDDSVKNWITGKFSYLTNVQTVAEYEASL